MKNEKILVVDDEKNLRESLVELLESENFAATEATDGADALEILRGANETFSAVLLDLKMPRVDGLEFLRIVREENLSNAPVIVLSAFSDSTRMIEAMRRGAFDYITKPLDIEEILNVVRRAVEQFSLSAQQEKSEIEKEKTSAEANEIIGTSRAMRDVFKQIGKLAGTDATILITGESGTGKELAANSIHEHSARAKKPFVAVNCGALPESLVESELFGYERGAFTGAERQKKGRFELANGGTLFLDEVGELTLNAQVKLLRALQERRFERVGGTETIAVDVRVVAATNRDLRREIDQKTFRADLFYRLSVVELNLPPLRERLADVPVLAEYFLEKTVRKHRLANKFLTDAAIRSLLVYNFPGTVRELENIVERAAISANAEAILPENLFPQVEKTAVKNASAPDFYTLPFHQAVAALERDLIRRALHESNNNRTEAAKRLGINRRLLYSKIEEHKIS